MFVTRNFNMCSSVAYEKDEIFITPDDLDFVFLSLELVTITPLLINNIYKKISQRIFKVNTLRFHVLYYLWIYV